MKFEDLLRSEASTIVNELNQLYGSVQIRQLPEMVDAIDAFLPQYVASRLYANCGAVVVGCKTQTSHPSSWLSAKGLDFEIIAGPRVGIYEELDVAFLRRDFPRQTAVISAAPVRVAEPGRYKAVAIEMSMGLGVRDDEAGRFVTEILASAYRWIAETIRKLVRREESDLVLEMYATFRAACIDDHLRDAVVFGAVSKGRSVYLVDSGFITHAMALAAAQSAAVLETPARIVAEILNSDIPYELSFSKDAIQSTRRIFDLRRTKYEETKGPLLPRAEAIIIGSASVAAFPIVREGEGMLVAVAPVSMKQSLERTLTRLGPTLSERFTAHRGLIGRILERLNKGVSPLQTAGDLAFLTGRFADGWFGRQ
ncbi:MAG TPA: hypothetical protein VEK57_28510 [Thermoanaerobaculia bacterium]|nr:hypothetical protein [Thermoanaerobaculia bacterium]